jgi:hypothetical protein
MCCGGVCSCVGGVRGVIGITVAGGVWCGECSILDGGVNGDDAPPYCGTRAVNAGAYADADDGISEVDIGADAEPPERI